MTDTKKGLFITFEGVEGCGKTTQVKMISDRLTAMGYQIVLTREPGGCPIANKIRGILLDAENVALVPKTELLLYAASRAQHIAEVIQPALDKGYIVLCDRYADSTTSYQGYGRGLDMELIKQLRDIATGGLNPVATVLYDLDPVIGVNRSMKRLNASSGADESRFEQEAMAFHQRVRSGFLDMAEQEPERFVIVEGANGEYEKNIEEMHEETFDKIMAVVSQWEQGNEVH